ncbi:polyphosphate kinase 1 [Thalassotalea sp. LPB0316]|uniref:polyphosphate kinase 1 n=1 Tax=Thalassotalea sp. LPB0316 TaxID=2769490 RepID=UPI0018674493|nr:polyphosphate kinase 1 [Thalassotalea sp. LPB0316]QOL27016.1 polyphosphate kinase 1 [Thalassotalea sp. LPB0316]
MDTPYYNKELSWLSFNERVLQEAADPNVPLIERIRFLGIYSSNLDEFFRVRAANIYRQSLLEAANVETEQLENMKWSVLFNKISDKVNLLTQQFQSYANAAFDELAKHNIDLIFNTEQSQNFAKKLSSKQRIWLKTFFEHQVIRHVTPIIISNKTQLAECLDDDGIYLLVALNKDENTQYALVEIPRDEIKRFIILPKDNIDEVQRIVMLDDILHYFLDDIFSGIFDYDQIEAYSIKLTRDAEYNLNDEIDQSLLDKMSKGLKQRLKADPVRLGYDRHMPAYMLKFLRKELKIKKADNLVAGVRYRHFKDFTGFPNLGEHSLEKTDLVALEAANIKLANSIFDAIKQEDILVYYPYYKFRHFTEFVRQASYDPAVKQIKINIYRVAKKSEIIHSLIEAVKNGKQVTVVVELKARFDEEANIEWSKLMKDAGIKVEFGIESLKIHSKLCLISREEHGNLVNYAHIGTGNFHEKNARIYTDFSLFTCHKEITQEVENVFSFIAHSYKRFRFNHLIVSPLTSRRRLYQLIDNEIENANQGKISGIDLKLNNLVDKGLINRLYQASNAGVKIRLLIRGMCTLVPGVKGFSENITAISIVDQFLEHPRVMVFYNQGDKQVLITSADWMERNIDQRVEVACPIYAPHLKQRILDILEFHFKDNVKARIIDRRQKNHYVKNTTGQAVRSQLAIYDYLRDVEDKSLKHLLAKQLTHE